MIQHNLTEEQLDSYTKYVRFGGREHLPLWFEKTFPDHRFIKIIEIGANSSTPVSDKMNLVVRVFMEKKTTDELFGEQMQSFIDRLSTAPKDFLQIREQRHLFGLCPDCGLKTDGWKPMFGSLAPEWWATMRERGIDPASGHALNCRYAKRR